MYPSRKPFIAFIVTLLLFTFAGPKAEADFYVVAGGGKKIGREITALPYTITEPGFYFITKNLECPYGYNGIYCAKASSVVESTCCDNTGPGIYAGIGSTIKSNTCYSNSNHGIYLRGDDMADQNTCIGNGLNMNVCPVSNPCSLGVNYAP